MIARNLAVLSCLVAGVCQLSAQEAAAEPVLKDQAGLINEAGWSLLQSLAAEGNENIAVSPASIRAAFCPIQRGTAGETQKQIATAFGENAVYEQWMVDYGAQDNGVSLANMLVVDKTLPLLPAYTEATPKDQLRMADFKVDPEGQAEAINSWVEHHTEGLIKDMLPKDIFKGIDTKFVALNAAAFDANWKYPFEERATRPGAFHAPAGDIQVDMMNNRPTGVVLDGPDSSVVLSLPYENRTNPRAVSDISFVIVLPKEGDNLNNFIANTKWEAIGQVLAADDKRPEEFKLMMPKFTIETPLLKLKTEIQKLGITDLFDATKADFTNMTREPGLYADDVLHKCVVMVNEKGTKAAAATVIGIAKMSLPVNEKTVVVDRPFVWFIYDNREQVALFGGTLSSPKETPSKP